MTRTSARLVIAICGLARGLLRDSTCALLSPYRAVLRHDAAVPVWRLDDGEYDFRTVPASIRCYGWCPEGESDPHAFRPVDFESRSSAIPTPGPRFANQDAFALHAIARAFHVVPLL